MTTVQATQDTPLCPGTGCPIRYMCAFYDPDDESRPRFSQIPGRFSHGLMNALEFTCSQFRSKGGDYDQEIDYIDDDDIVDSDIGNSDME